MKLINSYFSIFFIFILILFLSSCKKEIVNDSPSCKILGVSDLDKFIQGDSVKIIIEAFDNDGDIIDVKLSINEELVVLQKNENWEYAWNTSRFVGVNSLVAKCTDDFGDFSKDEVHVTIMENAKPFCSIVSPKENSVFVKGETISVVVEADDVDSEIDEVKLFLNGAEVGTDSDSAYAFELSSENLDLGTYQLKAVAKDVYGKISEHQIEVEFSNKGIFVDERDSVFYEYVKIGSQYWMAENLAYLPEVIDFYTDWSATEPRYYVFQYHGTDVAEAKQDEDYQTYGALYNWPAAKISCPSGWHLPTDHEWKELEIFIGMSPEEANKTGSRGTNEGEKLKATTGWLRQNGTDEYGLALKAGGCGDGALFPDQAGAYWTGTFRNSRSAMVRSFSDQSTQIVRYTFPKDFTAPVRCVRD